MAMGAPITENITVGQFPTPESAPPRDRQGCIVVQNCEIGRVSRKTNVRVGAIRIAASRSSLSRTLCSAAPSGTLAPRTIKTRMSLAPAMATRSGVRSLVPRRALEIYNDFARPSLIGPKNTDVSRVHCAARDNLERRAICDLLRGATRARRWRRCGAKADGQTRRARLCRCAMAAVRQAVARQSVCARRDLLAGTRHRPHR